ncbi:MAG: TetR/AcrR family transcriptional regulator, partial [Chloroflexota bacterium]
MAEARRGRPLGFEPDQAIHELMLLFWEQGYDGTTQTDMVVRTGLSSSSLYNTFGDKPAIFDRVLERYNSMTATGCEPLMTGTDGLAELEALLVRVHRHVAEPADTPAGC